MIRRRLPLSAGLVAILFAPAIASAALQTPERSEAEALYAEGQDAYDQGEYVEAARVWTEVLEQLPESKENAVARASLVFNIVEAYTHAFERVRDRDGHRDIEHLRAARRVADTWLEQRKAAYGEDEPIDPKVQDQLAELDRRIEEAERDPDDKVEPCLAPCLEPLPPPPATRSGCGAKNDRELALLGLPLLGFGRRKRREMLARLADRLPADVVRRLQEDDIDEQPRPPRRGE